MTEIERVKSVPPQRGALHGDVAKCLTVEPGQTRGGDGEHEPSVAAGGA
jgi:hypothetical protein